MSSLNNSEGDERGEDKNVSTSLPSLTPQPAYNSSPVPSEARRLYLGVHLTLHYSESAAVMRPKLSDSERTLPSAGHTEPRGDLLSTHALLTAYLSDSLTPLICPVQTQWPGTDG